MVGRPFEWSAVHLNGRPFKLFALLLQCCTGPPCKSILITEEFEKLSNDYEMKQCIGGEVGELILCSEHNSSFKEVSS